MIPQLDTKFKRQFTFVGKSVRCTGQTMMRSCEHLRPVQRTLLTLHLSAGEPRGLIEHGFYATLALTTFASAIARFVS